ncbi:hypothetical protein H1230_16430 [Paenibacillus sp. 19GGS1-52]|uniref:hypothetical protein n=1 Tax=Paenibacillus sp. 19GGS1-52 TaxID=2758563 RepID=UPI001EFA5204|nr:hypothetical protein [Paenibacillus sp. 19GGS1-52]ULO04750.1 hypothetical protein H1230_16430 [Paenibacillus sp. 19GGS1-52]
MVEWHDSYELEKAYDKLRDYRDRVKMVQDFGFGDAEDPNVLERYYIQDVQSAFMRGFRIDPQGLSLLFNNYESGKGDILDKIFEDHRKFIISAPFSPLGSTGLPTKKGDSEAFKEVIRSMIDRYKDRYAVLWPLLINLKITILYVPPKDQEIDLDNLARYIVPMVNEAIKPPTGIIMGEDPRPKGFPKHSIIQYQIIKLPRSIKDPEDGVVRLVLEEYERHNNLWREIDRLIEKWASKAM